MSITTDERREFVQGLERLRVVQARGLEVLAAHYSGILDDLVDALSSDSPESLNRALNRHGLHAFRAICLCLHSTRTELAIIDNERWLAEQENQHGQK